MKPVRKPASPVEAPTGTPRPGAGGTPRPGVPRPGGRPGSPTGKLEKKPKEGFKVPPVPILVGAVFGLLFIIFIAYMLWPAPTPDTAVVAADIQPQNAVDEFPVDAAPIYPDGYYLASPTPIQELGRQAAQKALADHPSYVLGQGLVLADGTTLLDNSPELIFVRDAVSATTTQQLQAMTETQVDPTTGNAVILVRDEATGQMTPISVSNQATSFEAAAYRMATANLDAQILAGVGPVGPVVATAITTEPVIEKQIIVENVLDDTEKRKYLSLIETQERENLRLRDKISDVQEDMATQRKQVVDVMQRIEDSPVANQRLRATMLPKSTGLKQQGIVGDRVWFEDKDGNLTTYRIGEVIDGTELVISGTDEASGVVLVTPR